MRTVLFFLLPLLLCLQIMGCSDDDDTVEAEHIPIYEPGDTTNGSASGFKNQWEWEASSVGAAFSDLDSIVIYGFSLSTYSEEGFLRETLTINRIPGQVFSYIFTDLNSDDSSPTVSYATVADDGDVLEDYYVFDDSTTGNELTITRLDTIARIIEGHFTAHVRINDPDDKRNPINPDRIRFQNVEFSVAILE